MRDKPPLEMLSIKPNKNLYLILKYLIALIWLINGLACKVLNIVPRHEKIVAEIVSEDHSRILTILIGISEIFMAIWIVSGIKSRFNAIVQIFIIATMNMLELIYVPELLLWGKMNFVFALILILIIYLNEFYLNPYHNKKTYVVNS